MIAIVDYEAGNLTSVLRAVRSLGFEAEVTKDPDAILDAERVIFPGVGAAGAAMENLRRTGLDRVLKTVNGLGTPLLGICLGTQIIFEYSDEDGGTECLGIFRGKTVRFPEQLHHNGRRLKVPHMGWNQVRLVKEHPVLRGVKPEHEFYFVHGYYPSPADMLQAVGWTDHGLTFASIVAQDNLIAFQFHLEKSGRPGLQILKNFCQWDGGYA